MRSFIASIPGRPCWHLDAIDQEQAEQLARAFVRRRIVDPLGSFIPIELEEVERPPEADWPTDFTEPEPERNGTIDLDHPTEC